MALIVDDLAQELWDSLSNKGGATELSDESKAYAEGFITAVQGGIVTLPLVTGTADAPGAFTGAAAGGIITNVISATMTNIIIAAGQFAAQPVAQANLTIENGVVCNYIMTGLVNFAMGKVTGTSTAVYVPPPGSSIPGILQNGEATDGVIVGYSGPALKSLVWSALQGQSGMGMLEGPDMINFYTALCDYTLTNAEVVFASGTINGTFAGSAPTGDPIIGGVGVGGSIL